MTHHVKYEEHEEMVADEVGSGSDEDSGDEDLIDDEKMDTMEKLNFDFEAFPPAPEDADQVNNFLTQIFLRTEIDYDNLSRAVVALTPFGSVIRTSEECVDEDNDDCMYGVASVLVLNSDKNYGIGDLLLQRAKKHATKTVAVQIEKLFKAESSVGFVINERMLKFPPQIAGPTLNALKQDILAEKSLERVDTYLFILKIRISDEELKKKAEDAEVQYDNEEEALLFEAFPENIPFFQYPVQSDVESTSKFAASKKGNVTLRPYRRVCILTKSQLFHYCDTVSQAF
ncbi:unnamed protein product [Bursaphelenchus okinawaensis]|uniref:Uncharacterized protein n=1 Tax=Bursaphelenchus okinawaensis TaxID=465554 RepID=A0A811L527_9BILA|nr:unnamed protein product [Bursaphelenchus okinawaensis]CAG9116595.1 unnamed protein product [Bursaphelenchus okinawaensis]